jgi:hypothetical protein
MTRKLTLLVSLAATLLMLGASGCSCGDSNPNGNPPPDGGGGPAPGTRGASCAGNSECNSGLSCQLNTCEPTTLPDGGPIPDGGAILPDGGVCVNLQCQQVSCPGGGTTSISGSVFDPSGQVPLYNAIVYVPNGPVEAFSNSGVTCDVCGSFTTGSPLVVTLTKSNGQFKLDNVPVGSNIPLVYQIGKWRRQVTIPSVSSCQNNQLTDVNQQRMPRNRGEGDIPRMAISTGSADPFECLLYKMGIDTAEITRPGEGGRIDFYTQNGMVLDGGSVPGSALWTDAGTLMQYDIVLLPCEGGANAKPDAGVNNLVNYTNQGGRVFATHYSYVWTAKGWPTSADWSKLDQSHPSDPFPYAAWFDTSFPKAQAFKDWLTNVGGVDGGVLEIEEARHDVIGVNHDGGTFQWLYTPDFPNSSNQSSGFPAVEELTFNTPYNAPPQADGGAPVQCGRVVFPDFHVTAGAVRGNPSSVKGLQFPDKCFTAAEAPLTPQEKALIFMLFDVSSCIQSDATAPSTCGGAGSDCASDGACCSGLACVDGSMAPCAGGACTCQALLH